MKRRSEMDAGFIVADGLAAGDKTVVFQRGADGSVVASKVPNPCPSPDDVQVLFIIDAASWASVVAHCSAEGGNADTFQVASSLHTG
jgi:hypothetical protein